MKKQFKIFAMTFLLFYLTGCNNDSALEEDSFRRFFQIVHLDQRSGWELSFTTSPCRRKEFRNLF